MIQDINFTEEEHETINTLLDNTLVRDFDNEEGIQSQLVNITKLVKKAELEKFEVCWDITGQSFRFFHVEKEYATGPIKFMSPDEHDDDNSCTCGGCSNGRI